MVMTEMITFLFSFMVDQVVLKYLMYENIKNELFILSNGSVCGRSEGFFILRRR